MRPQLSPLGLLVATGSVAVVTVAIFGLRELVPVVATERERYDALVLAARGGDSDGFAPTDIAWALEHAPGDVFVVRPGSRPKVVSR